MNIVRTLAPQHLRRVSAQGAALARSGEMYVRPHAVQERILSVSLHSQRGIRIDAARAQSWSEARDDRHQEQEHGCRGKHRGVIWRSLEEHRLDEFARCRG